MPDGYRMTPSSTGGFWVTPPDGPMWFASDAAQATEIARADAAEPPRRRGRPKGYPTT